MHIRTLASAVALGLLPQALLADDDHDHGHEPAAAAAAQRALPRFSAVSETFELVGIVDGRQVVVYIDRFADNAPVRAATIELDIGGARVALRERADGELEGTLAADLKPGVTAVTATIVAGSRTDLLAADLDVHVEEQAPGAARNMRRTAAWAAAVAVLLLLGGWALKRFRSSSARLRRGDL